jgi:thiol:disulfide interchange protein/DsbC/DsbD-like thiol-disulfide interchange protein
MNLTKLAALLLLVLLPSVTARAQFLTKPSLRVEASLIADTTAIVPGKAFRIGLVMKIEPKWHTYWQYPGDAGSPAEIKWQLPPGFEAGPIQWPVPETVDQPEAQLQTYAYHDEVMLIQTIAPPADLKAGATINLKAAASWLVCADICIPENTTVSLTLPVAESAEPANAAEFERWSKQVPSDDGPPFPVTWTRTGNNLVAKVTPPAGTTSVEFFPLPSADQIVNHTVSSKSPDGSFTVGIDSKDDLRGVIAIKGPDGERGWTVMAEPSAMAAAPAASLAEILGALGFGLLGGLILNLMPCVLPVISLKIFGFVQQAGQSRKRIALHGLSFSAGIFAWFLGLGALVVALKAGGSQVTWAFQFQNPWFNLAIATIVFVFALNLFGVFELTLPGRATNALAGAASTDGYGGSFFQGVFATLLATPCTGPFLGSSLGFAFSQPAPITLLLFASMAAGMALPYLALSLQPGWVRFLPKPGAWMERLKQFMGFPLLAALIWLLSIVAAQRPGALAGICAFLLTLGLALWLYGIASSPTVKTRSRVILQILAAAIAFGAGLLFLVERTDKIAWVPYSKAEVDRLISENKPVFIDFTADWCISCKFNERTAIDTAAVRKKMDELGIVPVKADWTSKNPEITAILQHFNRVGVPFYVLYPAGKSDTPVTLPELLTESLVLDALSKAK